MLSDDRRMRIYEYLKRNKSATTEELTREFGVSPSTVRRDLEVLANRKLIVRTHSGAIIESPNVEITFSEAYNLMKDEKRFIARRALDYINDNDFIALSGGSTSYILADEILKSDKLNSLTILTSSINIATLFLEGNKEFDLIVAGGVPRKGSYECVGELTMRTIRTFNIDKFFVGINGMSDGGEISFSHKDEGFVAQTIIERSKETFVICDHTKFNVTKQVKIADVADVEVIITDKMPVFTGKLPPVWLSKIVLA